MLYVSNNLPVSSKTYTPLYQVLCVLPRSTLLRVGNSRVPVDRHSKLYALGSTAVYHGLLDCLGLFRFSLCETKVANP